MPTVHPTACVDPLAELGDDVQVGPYVVIEGAVTVGARTIIRSHSVLNGPTVVGADCRIGPAAHVGLEPQHLGLDGKIYSDLWLTIGDRTIIREGASIHRASKPGRENATKLGNQCFLMGGAHVAHDCRIEDGVVLAQNVLLGGHVQIGRRAFLGGGAGVHQFVRIGRLAMIAGNEGFSNDVFPFAAVRYGGLKGYNAIGCRRAGLGREAITAIRRTFHLLHLHRLTRTALTIAGDQFGHVPEFRELLDFAAHSRRGLLPSVRFARSISREERGDGPDAI